MMTSVTSSASAISIDPRIRAIAAGIVAAIPEAQVRLFGSRARGTARPDSDVDLLITVPDHWRIESACWEISRANIPAIGYRWICSFIPKAKSTNATSTGALLPPRRIRRESCCMADPDAIRYFRIAQEDLHAD